MPKMRKENLFCESDINSIHQKALLDYIYDHQDLYVFYEDQQSFPSFEVKCADKPFSGCLSNLETFLNDLSFNEKAIRELINLRFFNFEGTLIDFNLLNTVDMYHPLTQFLGHFVRMTVFFCRLSKQYLEKYVTQHEAYTNEYLKRVYFLNSTSLSSRRL